MEKTIDIYFGFLKSQIANNDKEKELMKYFENTWMKKYKKLFNYGYLINNKVKISKLYIYKKGDKSSENALISNLKSLEKVYFTYNIYESIHAEITKYVDNNVINKNLFRDTIRYIIRKHSLKFTENIRGDYIYRSIIIIIEKYRLNEHPIFVYAKISKKEIEKIYQ